MSYNLIVFEVRTVVYGMLDTLLVDEVNESKALGLMIVIERKHQHLYLTVLLKNIIQLGLLHCLGNILYKDAGVNNAIGTLTFRLVLGGATGPYEILLAHGKGAALLAVNLEEAQVFANFEVVLVRFALYLHESRHKLLVYVLDNRWWLLKNYASALFKNLSHFL